MKYGTDCPRGMLPVFSVADKREAMDLLTMACPINLENDFVAPELAKNQSIEALMSFGKRLKELHDKFLMPKGRCRCTKNK